MCGFQRSLENGRVLPRSFVSWWFPDSVAQELRRARDFRESSWSHNINCAVQRVLEKRPGILSFGFFFHDNNQKEICVNLGKVAGDTLHMSPLLTAVRPEKGPLISQHIHSYVCVCVFWGEGAGVKESGSWRGTILNVKPREKSK